MKVAIIGEGNVGLATFRELQNLREVNEITMIGLNQDKIKGEIDDYKDSIVLRPEVTPKLTYGGYEQAEGADIIIYAAGSPRQPGMSSRLDLLMGNIEIVHTVFEEVNKYNQDSIIIVLSNPVDIITFEIARITGRPRNKVIGTGTLLDTARCIKGISEFLNISPNSIYMFVIGEHGDSSVTLLSSLKLLGMTLDEYLSNEIGTDISVKRDRITENVRNASQKLLKTKGYTAYGVASAATRLVYEIAHDTNMILPVSTVLEGEYGVDNLAISVPCVIGRNGIAGIHQMKLTEEEMQCFMNSVSVIKKAEVEAGLI